MSRQRERDLQRGNGLIDIFLSLLIMVLLFSGFINFMISQKSSCLANSDYLQCPTNNKWVTRLTHGSDLAKHLQPQNAQLSKNYQANLALFPPNAQIILGTTKDTNNSDTITVQYQGNGSGTVFNCLGIPLTAKQTTQSLFFINDQSMLACRVSKNGTPDLEHENILIENVETMSIRYGIDTNHDGTVDNYVASNTSDFTFDRVMLVRIRLLLRTTEWANPLIATKYYILDGTELGPFNDPYQRKVLTMTLPVQH